MNLGLCKSVFFINYVSFDFLSVRLFKKIMTNNLLEIDLAMNMIKEEITRELSESVTKQNNQVYINKQSASHISFSEKTVD